MKSLLDGLALHTVCESAHCPNQGDCLARRTATFMILGDVCTRNCRFCAVSHGRPAPTDPEEPRHIAEAAGYLGLRYVVITSVTRDDLPDGGAAQFAACIRELRALDPSIGVEVLVPDFRGDWRALDTVMEARPAVLNHNVETVPRLYASVRPQAGYARSVELLWRAKEMRLGALTKSGMMLGLGEEREEVLRVMHDLREAGCDFLTLGQYLAPSDEHHPVVRFIPPEEFDEYARLAREAGFQGVAAAPLVRSSYHAGELFGAGAA